MKLPDNNTSTAITVLKGELDLYRSQELYENIASCFEAGGALRIDISRVTRIDLACIQILVAARRQCVQSGIAFSLLNPTREYLLFLQLCGLEQALLRYDPDGCFPAVDVSGSSGALRFQFPERHEQWHVSARFGSHVYRDGGDIPACLQQLKTSGILHAVRPVLAAIPVFSSLVTDQCYMGFEIACDADASRVLIENIFEPVAEHTDLIILSPGSSVREYAILLQQRYRDSQTVRQFWAQTGLLNSRQIAAVDELCEAQLSRAALVSSGEEPLEVSTAEAEADEENFVDTGRHDATLDMLGEMLIACASSRLLAARLGEQKLLDNIELIDRLACRLQESMESLRTASLRDLFNCLARKGMETGRELGVETGFVLHSGGLELDATVLSEVSGLLHAVVRFLIEYSRGIPVPTRPSGVVSGPGCRIRLKAHADGDYVVLVLQTLQRQLDVERLEEERRRAGKAGNCDELVVAELRHLVLEAAFDEVYAGRRILASDRLAAIGGSVEFVPSPGQGDSFVLRLPVSASVVDGVLISVGENSYLVPRRHLLETVERLSDDSETHYYHNTVHRHGEILPLIRLREVLKVDAEPVTDECMVVVECGRHRVGLVGDALDGEFRSASRPLGRVLSQLKSLRGATLLPTGKVAMVLDIVGLIQDMVSTEEQAVHSSAMLQVGKCVH